MSEKAPWFLAKWMIVPIPLRALLIVAAVAVTVVKLVRNEPLDGFGYLLLVGAAAALLILSIAEALNARRAEP